MLGHVPSVDAPSLARPDILAHQFPMGIWEHAEKLYAVGRRGYHTFDHAIDVLVRVNHLHDVVGFVDIEAARLAALYHDAVYEVGVPSGTNERNSIAVLPDSFSELTICQAADLIRCTAYHTSPRSSFSSWDILLFMDCDMMGFAAPWETFLKQNDAIDYESGVAGEKPGGAGDVSEGENLVSDDDAGTWCLSVSACSAPLRGSGDGQHQEVLAKLDREVFSRRSRTPIWTGPLIPVTFTIKKISDRATEMSLESLKLFRSELHKMAIYSFGGPDSEYGCKSCAQDTQRVSEPRAEMNAAVAASHPVAPEPCPAEITPCGCGECVGRRNWTNERDLKRAQTSVRDLKAIRTLSYAICVLAFASLITWNTGMITIFSGAYVFAVITAAVSTKRLEEAKKILERLLPPPAKALKEKTSPQT